MTAPPSVIPGKPHERVRVLVKRVGDVAVPLPEYQTEDSAGMDLYAAIAESVTLAPGARHFVPTGLAFEIPIGYEGQVRPRSGLALRYGIGIVNSPGTIDSDYRGEIGIVLINWGDEAFVIEPKSRIAQLVVAPVARAVLVEAGTLSDTGRGDGGYGSTGG